MSTRRRTARNEPHLPSSPEDLRQLLDERFKGYILRALCLGINAKAKERHEHSFSSDFLRQEADQLYSEALDELCIVIGEEFSRSSTTIKEFVWNKAYNCGRRTGHRIIESLPANVDQLWDRTSITVLDALIKIDEAADLSTVLENAKGLLDPTQRAIAVACIITEEPCAISIIARQLNMSAARVVATRKQVLAILRKHIETNRKL